MTQSSEKPDAKGAAEQNTEGELSSDELEQVNGGIALLVPAIQKVREATKPSSSDVVPTEEVALNFTKIE